ncbi:MAG TPA: conjugal transfer protein, partial [Candidatus Angelobacter sp.]|nr:conjugal transfer protein [Candidatus Angelobacter sp.]
VGQADGGENLIAVERANGEQVTYDPRRLQGVAVYRESEREFSEGDRVQFTAPSKELHVANRELGTIESIRENGPIAIRTDSGRAVEFNIEDHPHLDYGYAVTSHSSQGQTSDRVLIHADTEEGEHLVNSRMAYVSVSRGRYDAQIYTNDKSELAHHLGREVSQSTALTPEHEHHQNAEQEIGAVSTAHDVGQEHDRMTPSEGHSEGAGQGQDMGE